MAETKTYEGSCHCGRVSYEADADLEPGHLLQLLDLPPARLAARFCAGDKFRLQTGADALTEYEFNKKIIHHLFCSTCGVLPFARGTRPDGGRRSRSMSAASTASTSTRSPSRSSTAPASDGRDDDR